MTPDPIPLNLLIVDDDVELCAMMREFFAAQGHQLAAAHDGRSGLALALDKPFDLLILDVMLPILNGFEVLAQLRHRSRLPVILLTARAQREDRLHGLDSGADDYLPKPFDPDELLARIRAVLRRSDSAALLDPEALTVGPLRLNLSSRQATLDDALLDLTAIEFDLLEMLVRHVGRILSRDEIVAAIFAREANPYDRFLDVHISHLRSKLADHRNLIRTIRGAGYVLASEN
jgi:two-component system response regulator CpxR